MDNCIQLHILTHTRARAHTHRHTFNNNSHTQIISDTLYKGSYISHLNHINCTFVNTATARFSTPSKPWNESRLQSGVGNMLFSSTISVSRSWSGMSVSGFLTCSIWASLCHKMLQMPLSMYKLETGTSPCR